MLEDHYNHYNIPCFLFSPPDWSEKDKKHLGQELSDVLIYLVRLAEKCEIDLPKEALAKMTINAKKYPAQKVKGSNKKYTEYTD